MARRKMKAGKGKKVQPMAGPPSKPVYEKTAKKPGKDDRAQSMHGGTQPGGLKSKRMKRLKGMMI